MKPREYFLYSCIQADAEECMLLAFDGLYPKWRYADEKRQKGDELLKKVIFIFFA